VSDFLLANSDVGRLAQELSRADQTLFEKKGDVAFAGITRSGRGFLRAFCLAPPPC